MISKCQPGYHIKADSSGMTCVQNTDTDCGKPDSSSTTSCIAGNIIGKCNSEGVCEMTACTSGCLFNGQCVNDESHCGPACLNCNGYGGSSAARCTNDKCEITSCSGNMHISDDGSSCVTNSTASCGQPSARGGENCNSRDPNGTWNCNYGSCELTGCKSNYHTNGNFCEENTDSNCGSHGNRCPSGYSCNGKTCAISDCNAAGKDGADCTSDGRTGKCKPSGSNANTPLTCQDENERNDKCFYDNRAGWLPCSKYANRGATGTCVYLNGGRNGDDSWSCECSNGNTIHLKDGSYVCK